MSIFKEVADIKTADMLDLPVPKANFHTIAVKPTEVQREFVMNCADRAEAVRDRSVDSTVDNMLKITNDGRKIALDPRLINPLLEDEKVTKVNACVNNVFNIWKDGTTPENNEDPTNQTQLVFCDMSTPKTDGTFNVYDDIREKLVKKGMQKEQIAFIHEAKTDIQKDKLFAKMKRGEIRVLLGSTQKMGAGTNVQERLKAIHHLDCPWRPSDLEQRNGRVIRQGNLNKEVDVYNYVTSETFDAYLYQLVENKQKFISQIMSSKAIVRSAEDIDETALSYAEIKMLATGNPYIKEKMDLDIQVARLKLLKSNYQNEIYQLQDFIYKDYPTQLADVLSKIDTTEKDVAIQMTHPEKISDKNFTNMNVMGKVHYDKEMAGRALLESMKGVGIDEKEVGEYRGFKLIANYSIFESKTKLTIKNNGRRTIDMGIDVFGNIQRIDNAINNIPLRLNTYKEVLTELENQLEVAKVEVEKTFDKDDELNTKLARLKELDSLLNLDKSTAKQETEDQQNANESNGIIETTLFSSHCVFDNEARNAKLMQMPSDSEYGDYCYYLENSLIVSEIDGEINIKADISSSIKIFNDKTVKNISIIDFVRQQENRINQSAEKIRSNELEIAI